MMGKEGTWSRGDQRELLNPFRSLMKVWYGKDACLILVAKATRHCNAYNKWLSVYASRIKAEHIQILKMSIGKC